MSTSNVAIRIEIDASTSVSEDPNTNYFHSVGGHALESRQYL